MRSHPDDRVTFKAQRELEPATAARLSRRHFVSAVGLAAAAAAAAAALRPVAAFAAEETGIVDTIKQAAATDEITVVKLRGNVYVLTGSGGNIAVLPGEDGKLLIDAGIAVSQKKIAAALQGISPDPVQQLVNTHWHFDTRTGMTGCTLRARRSPLTRTRASGCPCGTGSRGGGSPFRRHPRARSRPPSSGRTSRCG